MSAQVPGRNARLAAVRLYLHDLMCTSYRIDPDRGHCTGAGRIDHAKRQHDRARAVVDGSFEDVLDAIHYVAHLVCESPARQCITNVEAPAVVKLADMAGIGGRPLVMS